MSEQFLAIARAVLWSAAVLVWGVVGAACGALIGWGIMSDLAAPFGAVGCLLGMLCGAVAFKRKAAHLAPEALFESAVRITEKKGNLYEGGWVLTKKGWKRRLTWLEVVFPGKPRKKRRS
ncbi:MAG: hypothetical protein HYZ07_02405 [Candidatus Harrisonbacteria bacterium]|nr:hypothetical protein [Candidatus Harrisonbacteria bacterium]